MEKQRAFTVREKERWVTRIVAFALGMFSILTPLLTYIIQENSRQEWATAGPLKLMALIVGCVVCAAFGGLFVAIAIKGTSPNWLAKHLKQRGCD